MIESGGVRMPLRETAILRSMRWMNNYIAESGEATSTKWLDPMSLQQIDVRWKKYRRPAQLL